jgi:integrase/recombinase XerC
MTAVAIYNANALAPNAADDTGARLYAAFLSGRSANTRDAYARDLVHFASFAGTPSPAEALAHLLALPHGDANGALLAYRSHMAESGLTPATVNRRLSAVRSAVKLARTLGHTTWAPEIDGLKLQSYRDTLGPGVDGTRAMLTAAREQDAIKAARDVALIRLMFDLGLRRGEIAGLDLADLDTAGRRLWIMGKGRTQKEARTIPEQTLAALQAWLDVRGSIAPTDEHAIFIGLAGPVLGKRITGRGLHHVIATLGKGVGIKTRPHGLRHASITAALDANGGDVRAVQQHARHANPQTTMRYDDNRRDLAGRVAQGLAGIL